MPNPAMKDVATALGDQMRALALVWPGRRADLEAAAKAFDEATAGCLADPPTHTVKQMVGAWARARRLYCEVAGKPAGWL